MTSLGKKKRGLRAAFIIIISLFVIRLILPFVLLWVINWALANKLGNYEGHVRDLDLSLYRGAYELIDLEIKKKQSDLPPLLKLESIDLSLSWKALWRREIAADVKIQALVIQLFDSQKKEKQQLGNDEKEKNWQASLAVIIPIKIESLLVSNSAIYFNNYDVMKTVPVKLEQIHLEARNLRTRDVSGSVLSPFSSQALLQNHAHLEIDGELDVLAEKPRAYLRYSLKSLNIPTMNSVLLTYVPISVDHGQLSVYGEAATSHSKVKGYVNLFLKDVKVFDPKQKFVSLKHFAYEVVLGIANWILKNQQDKTLAAHVPFQDLTGKWDIKASPVFWSATKNRTIEIPMGFDHSIRLQDLEK